MNKARFTAIPAARSAANVLRVRLVLVFTVLAITCLSGIFAGAAYLTFEPKYVDVYEPVPLARSEATVVAEAFMNGTLYSVSVTANMVETFESLKFTKVDKVGPIVWSGFERKTSIVATADTHMVELHKFLYMRPVSSVAANGEILESVQLMSLRVLMYIPKVAGDGSNSLPVPDPRFPPALAALPSIEAEEIFRLGQVVDYSEFNMDPAQEVSDIAVVWANHWAQGDNLGLKKVSGDADVKVTQYRFLGGYTVNSLTILGILANTTNTVNLLRIRIVLTGANGSILSTDMDITVTEANTGLPKVSGWGPAGSGVLALEDIRLGS